ncbi:hypothetical protein HQN60_01230 [Deefgea piscis]|uniref:Uncharacterized protein n=1 Tax=Deefgea piscis TaxID=2739061 RepID=A0A6M8SQA5_9NEIS|nr:hypothetical protein [Deefgea piscis]QKJ65466.1 hypothetical protein HQN60_01230 [Deefgea piscis]
MKNKSPYKNNLRRFKSVKVRNSKKFTDQRKSHWIDTFINRGSAIAQIGTLALACFGYFYTVIPVFQNQKLQEDNARLQIDIEKKESVLAELQFKKDDLSSKFDRQKSTLNQLALELKSSISNLKDAQIRKVDAMSQASLVKSQLNDELDNLDSARWKIVFSDLSLLLAFAELRAYQKLSAAMYEEKNGSQFIKNAKNALIDPASILKEVIEASAKNNKYIPLEYHKKIEEHLNENKEKLACPAPDFDVLATNYEAELLQVESIVKKEAEDEIERQRAVAKNEGKLLIVDKDDLSRVMKSIRLGKEFDIRNKYRKEIYNYRDTCSAIIRSYTEKLRSNFNFKD